MQLYYLNKDHIIIGEGYMKKSIAICMVLLAGLFTMLFTTSCGEEKDDNSTLLLLTAVGEPEGTPIYLFEVTNSHDGDFDDDYNGNPREELDDLAVTEYLASYTSLNCTEVHAFISVSGSDEIRDMLPGNRPIQTAGGQVIAASKSDLLDGDIIDSLNNLGVTSAENYWTGSTRSGALDNENCNSWTFATSDKYGTVGAFGYNNFNWISSGFGACSQMNALLGVCW